MDEKTVNEMLKGVNRLRLRKVRGRLYLNTDGLGMDVWYGAYLKRGYGNGFFMAAIENPDRRVSLITAREMGEGRNLERNVELVKQFYSGVLELESAGFPSYPADTGPEGVVILNRDGKFEEVMGFSGRNFFNGYTNEEYNDYYGLVQALFKQYTSKILEAEKRVKVINSRRNRRRK